MNISKAIEGNFLSLLPYNKNWPKATVYDEPDLFFVITDIESALFNNVANARLSSTDMAKRVEFVIEQVEKRRVPVTWWTGPSTHPGNLGDILVQRGFVKIGEAPGLAIDLDELGSDKKGLRGFIIEKVEDEKSLKDWSNVIGESFSMSESEIEACNDYIRYYDRRKTCMYLGLLNKKPVATSLLHLDAGVAGIYSVSTRPKMRKMGIGTLMTEVPLLEAKENKFKIGVLQSSEMSNGLYRSMGFKEYCRMGQYLWQGE